MSFEHHAEITARYRRYRRLNLRAAAGIVSGTAIALLGAGLGSDQIVLAGSLVTVATAAATMMVDIVWARRDRADPVWRHAPGFSPSHYQLYRTGDTYGDPSGLVAARNEDGGAGADGTRGALALVPCARRRHPQHSS